MKGPAPSGPWFSPTYLLYAPTATPLPPFLFYIDTLRFVTQCVVQKPVSLGFCCAARRVHVQLRNMGGALSRAHSTMHQEATAQDSDGGTPGARRGGKLLALKGADLGDCKRCAGGGPAAWFVPSKRARYTYWLFPCVVFPYRRRGEQQRQFTARVAYAGRRLTHTAAEPARPHFDLAAPLQVNTAWARRAPTGAAVHVGAKRAAAGGCGAAAV